MSSSNRPLPFSAARERSSLTMASAGIRPRRLQPGQRAGQERLAGRHAGAEQPVEVHHALRIARAVVDLPPVAQRLVEDARKGVRVGVHSLRQVDVLGEGAVAVGHGQVREGVADQRAGARVQSRQTLAGAGERDGCVEDVAVVQLAIADEQRSAVGEVILQPQPQLAAAIAGEARIAQAVVRTIETADRERQPVGQRAGDIGVEAIVRPVADLALHQPLQHARGPLGQHVDHAAWRIRRGDRGGTATHDLERIDGRVDAEEFIGVGEGARALLPHRQAILQQRQVTVVVGRKPARIDVVADLAARAFNIDARRRRDQVGHAQRRLLRDRFRVDRGDGVGGFELAHPGVRAGDDDLVQAEVAACSFASGVAAAALSGAAAGVWACVGVSDTAHATEHSKAKRDERMIIPSSNASARASNLKAARWRSLSCVTIDFCKVI